ncbi:TolC family protein [Burkholderia ubonensis]|uniref:TolC family protein n=1 Tax=Burkholderia ubonensis TaxID=101571 RepID=UPI0012F844C4|nr:TolC family protein [Burkholderia ubonensis]
MLMRNLAALAVLAAVASAHAQPSLIQAPPGDAAPAAFSPPLTLADALGIAARNNPALRGALADSNASVGALMQAGARPNPELSLLQEGFGGTERTTTALVNQTIELGGKRRARLDFAAYGREAAVATLDEQGAAVRADVTSAFYGLLAAQRQLQVTEESAALAAAAVQIEVATARSRVEIAREKLNEATGSVRTEARVAVGDLEALPAVAPFAVLAEQLADAPLARVTRAEMLRSNAAVSLERAKRMPDVTVSAGMKRVVTGPGTGLGLAIVRSIMDNHGGECGVDSKPGKRTTFWLRFPHRVAVAKPPRA